MPEIITSKYKKTKHIKGFSLVEMTVIITIISVLLATSLSVGASRIEYMRVVTTNDRVDFVMEAIKNYATRYNSLPCPASPKVSQESATFGIGAGSGTGTCSAANIISVGGNVRIGAVPTNTLGIAPNASFDGWEHRLRYIVDQDFTERESFETGTGGNITVYTTQASGATGRLITNEAVVAVISHGPNGFGAWRAKTIETTDVVDITGQGEDELVNNDDIDEVFVQRFPSGTADTVVGLFDDTVEYRMKWQLIRETND